MVTADLQALLIISLIAIVYMLISTLAQRFLTDQKALREAREKMKQLQREIRGLPPQKTLEKQAEMMRLNTVFMRENMRVLPWTLLPAFLVFILLAAWYGALPLQEGTPLTFTLLMKDASPIQVTGTNVTILNVSQQKARVQLLLQLNAPSGLVLLKSADGRADELVLSAGSTRVKPSGSLVKRVLLPPRFIVDDIPLPWPKRFTWLGVYILVSLLASLAWRRILQVV